MENITEFKHSLSFLVLLLISTVAVGQTQQKFRKIYPVQKDVAVKVDARHTKLVFETWDRNELEIETFIDTKDLSQEEISKVMAAWQVKVKGDKAVMNISSEGPGSMAIPPLPPMNLDSLGAMTAEMLGPLMNNLVPMLEGLSENPLPAEFMEGVGSINFDHEAYKRDGEKYLEKWEKEIEGKFGPEMEAAMEEWGEKFEKNSEAWSAKMEVEMETWGQSFGEDMEKWAAQFGSDMEAWGEQFGKEMEQWGQDIDAKNIKNIHKRIVITDGNPDSKIKKTMLVRMPKAATLTLNVRYGEVQLAEMTTNLQANLSHSKLVGKTISGPKTTVEASYTPVSIKDWQYGVLIINYVKNCSIENAKSLALNSVSSDVKIGKLQETGLISGTFANLEIKELAPQFKNLDITVENSELQLDLPETAFRFNYTGSKSKIKYPSSIKAEPVKSYDNEMINGYQKSDNGAGIVNIKANFSEVVIE